MDAVRRSELGIAKKIYWEYTIDRYGEEMHSPFTMWIERQMKQPSAFIEPDIQEVPNADK